MPTRDLPTAVIDTNVALDLLLFAEPGVASLALALDQGLLGWVACTRMGDELLHVLSRGLASDRHADAAAVHQAWRGGVELRPDPATSWRLRCSDSDDQVFIDLAVEQRATWLISRDRAVLKLARRARALGVAILTPAQWAEDWATRVAAATRPIPPDI